MATFLNQERWKDEVRELASEPEKVARTRCMVLRCESVGNHVDEGGSLCDWHWGKKYDRAHLKMLYENLGTMGLALKDNESREDWSKRCREYLKTTAMGKALGA